MTAVIGKLGVPLPPWLPPSLDPNVNDGVFPLFLKKEQKEFLHCVSFHDEFFHQFSFFFLNRGFMKEWLVLTYIAKVILNT